MKKVLLYSGGMDSWLIDKIWEPDVKLFIDVGTEASKIERQRLPKDVIIKEFDLSEYEVKNERHFLPLRNLFFVEFASYYGDVICLGSMKEIRAKDNEPKFAKLSTKLLNYLFLDFKRDVFGGKIKKIKIVMPWANKTKEDLLKEYLKKYPDGLQKAFDESFSCFEPIDGKECGKCPSCLHKREAFRNVGFDC